MLVCMFLTKQCFMLILHIHDTALVKVGFMHVRDALYYLSLHHTMPTFIDPEKEAF